MKKYNLTLADDINLELDDIIERKRRHGTYESNIEKFLKLIEKAIKD